MIEGWARHKDRFSKEALYGFLGISRQGAYQKKKRRDYRTNQETEVIEQVHKIRLKHRHMGSRVMYYRLKDPPMGINSVEQLLSRKNLTVKKKRKRKWATDSRGSKRFANLVNGLIISDINQVVVSDLFYFFVRGCRYYVFGLRDLYSHCVMGLWGDTSKRSDSAMVCLKQMENLRGAQALSGLIHHSDAGSEYRSSLYIDWLVRRKIRISEAKKCLENGHAEQFNGMVRNDYLINYSIGNVRDLQKALLDIRMLINTEKPVKSLGYKTPFEFEQDLRNTPLDQREKIELYDFTVHYPERKNGFSQA